MLKIEHEDGNENPCNCWMRFERFHLRNTCVCWLSGGAVFMTKWIGEKTSSVDFSFSLPFPTNKCDVQRVCLSSSNAHRITSKTDDVKL